MAFRFTDKVLGVAGGGTGLTSAPTMCINLASTTAASPFTASSTPGVTGALPIGNGGTGKTTAADARSALGIKKLTVARTDLDNIAVNKNTSSIQSITITKDGYTPLCIVGFNISNGSTNGTYSSYCYCYQCYLQNSTTVRFGVRNMHQSTNAIVKLQVWVLYGS